MSNRGGRRRVNSGINKRLNKAKGYVVIMLDHDNMVYSLADVGRLDDHGDFRHKFLRGVRDDAHTMAATLNERTLKEAEENKLCARAREIIENRSKEYQHEMAQGDSDSTVCRWEAQETGRDGQADHG